MKRLKSLLLSRPVWAAAIVLAAAYSPLLFSMGRLSFNDDFMQLAARHLVMRRALLLDGEFPLRTQYLNGGFPSLGDPEDPSLSPFSAFTVLFGEIAGLKLIALFILAAGFSSMYLMLRRLCRYGRGPAAFGALAYGLSGWFVTRLYSGNVNELYYFLLPGIILSARSWAVDGKPAGLALGAIALAAVGMDGKMTLFCLLLFLFLYFIAEGFARRAGGQAWDIKPSLRFAALGAFAFLIGAVKFAQVGALFAEKGSLLMPHIDSHGAGYSSVFSFGFADLARGALLPGTAERSVSLYIGIPGALLLSVPALACFRRNAVWLLLGAVFAVLWAGPSSPLDLFRVLWSFPFFNSISQPHKYFDFFLVFCACAVMPCALELPLRGLRRGPAAAVRSAAAAAALLPLLIFTAPKAAAMFSASRPPLPPGNVFFQVKLDPAAGNGGAQMYFNAAQNVGTLNWYGAIRLPAAAEPRYELSPGKGLLPNPAYKGEVYCAGTSPGPGASWDISANSVRLGEGWRACGRVVINQNYAEGWSSEGGRVENYGGLLSLRPGNSGPLRLSYRPRWFLAGLAVSVAALLAAAWLLLSGGRPLLPRLLRRPGI